MSYVARQTPTNLLCYRGSVVRQTWVTVGAALAIPLGCTLLDSYPGGKEPGEVLSGSIDEGTFDEGALQEPLIDPAIDGSIIVTRNITEVLAHPGDAFPIDMRFDAKRRNVVGGGIQFPGSKEVQWTFIEDLKGEEIGDIRFGFVVENGICDDIPNLCHELKTKQFAVAENPDGADVDGDGEPDGQFVVSPPVDVTVVLVCATCESPSCREILPPGECQQCTQATECSQYFTECLDPETSPDVSSEDIDLFEGIFGQEGVLWSTIDGCALGEDLCKGALVDPVDRCPLGGGEGETGGGEGGGSTGG